MVVLGGGGAVSYERGTPVDSCARTSGLPFATSLLYDVYPIHALVPMVEIRIPPPPTTLKFPRTNTPCDVAIRNIQRVLLRQPGDV